MPEQFQLDEFLTKIDSYNAEGVGPDAQPLVVTEPTCLAQIMTNTRNHTKQYFIKKVNYGELASFLANPYAPAFKLTDYTASRSGRSKLEFYEVSENVYKLYLKFLQTRNEAYYRMAEREKNAEA